MTVTQSTNNAPIKPRQGQRWLNSIGSRLFISIMAGATLGLGITATLFYQTLEQRSTSKISEVLNNQVGDIESKLGEARYFIKGMANSLEFARNEQKVSDKEVYKQLIFKSFLKRPNLAMAAYFLQAPNGIASETKWFAPYFYINQKAPGQQGQKLPAPYNNVIYSDLWTDDDYPNKDYYKTEINAPQESLLIEPYIWYGTTMTSFMTKVRDSQNKIIGLAGVDINVTQIGQNTNESVLEDAGYFSLLSEQGKLLSYPPDQNKAKAIESYQTIPALQKNWSQFTAKKSGFIREGGNYWFYQRVPSNNWLMLAVVPESVVTGPIWRMTLLGSLAAAGILAAIVALFVQRLNRSLKPILDECNKLSQADDSTQELLNSQDEIGQLSASFFNLLEQVKENERTIRQEAAMRLGMEEEQRQAIEAESTILQEDIARLLDAVSAVEEGNLTVQAPVSDRVTGLVSDTLNRLIEQLNRVMSTVSLTARQVTDSASDLELSAIQSADRAKQQAQAVDRIKILVRDVTDLTQGNSEQTREADTAIQEAQNAVILGQQQMNLLNQEIESLQGGTSQITRRVQTLSEFVQLAVQFVKAQKRTASMTRVLALNAALISTRAMEQQDPEQFASIAREFETITSQVNDLAGQTNQDLAILQQQTDRIQAVVSGLSQDVGEINQVVRVFTTGVDESNQVFENIQSVTNRVVRVGQRVAESSQAIAQVSQTTLTSMQDIAALAMTTEQRADLTRKQSSSMGQISRELLEIMSFFQISTEEMEASSRVFNSTREDNSTEPTLSVIG
jgi:methyl-accepting chemotaxis protein